MEAARLETESAAGVGGTILGRGIIESGIPFVITFLQGERAKRRISLAVRVLRIFLNVKQIMFYKIRQRKST